MKKEDFERLKAVCEKEGFEIKIQSIEGYNQDYTFIAKKKDIWEGVEFVECINSEGLTNVQKSVIYKPYRITPSYIIDNVLSYTKARFKPSTEQAYVEQLKKEAFERFGEIKEGDRFDESKIDGYYYKNRIVECVEFNYFKDIDVFLVGEATIYRNGKWATKLPKRVEVENISRGWKNNRYNGCNFTFGFQLKDFDQKRDLIKIGDFLASQLEKYLNGEIE